MNIILLAYNCNINLPMLEVIDGVVFFRVHPPAMVTSETPSLQVLIELNCDYLQQARWEFTPTRSTSHNATFTQYFVYKKCRK